MAARNIIGTTSVAATPWFHTRDVCVEVACPALVEEPDDVGVVSGGVAFSTDVASPSGLEGLKSQGERVLVDGRRVLGKRCSGAPEVEVEAAFRAGKVVRRAWPCEYLGLTTRTDRLASDLSLKRLQWMLMGEVVQGGTIVSPRRDARDVRIEVARRARIIETNDIVLAVAYLANVAVPPVLGGQEAEVDDVFAVDGGEFLGCGGAGASTVEIEAAILAGEVGRCARPRQQSGFTAGAGGFVVDSFLEQLQGMVMGEMDEGIRSGVSGRLHLP